MNKDAIKDMMFGGITELMKNRQFYHSSTVGPAYCYWTEEGREALQGYMDLMAYKMLEADSASLDKRAKDLVINGLKGDKV